LAFDFASSEIAEKSPSPQTLHTTQPTKFVNKIAAMAEAGVSASALKLKIEQQLQTTHVEIEDMSGLSNPPRHCPSLCGCIC